MSRYFKMKDGCLIRSSDREVSTWLELCDSEITEEEYESLAHPYKEDVGLPTIDPASVLIAMSKAFDEKEMLKILQDRVKEVLGG